MQLKNFSQYDINVENGTIYSYKSNSTIGHLTDDGYMRTTIYDDDNNRTFVSHHRIVWEVVNGPIPEGYEIHHIDKDRRNNSISNLELIEKSKHKHHHFAGCNNPMYGKPNPQASTIGKQYLSKKVGCYTLDGELVKTYSSTRDTSIDGFSPPNVSKCCNAIIPTYKNFIWKFMG